MSIALVRTQKPEDGDKRAKVDKEKGERKNKANLPAFGRKSDALSPKFGIPVSAEMTGGEGRCGA